MGSNDGWYCLSDWDDLAKMCDRCFPHTNQESYFELMW